MTAVVFVKTLRRRPYDGHRFAYNDPQSPVSWRGVAVTREGEARIPSRVTAGAPLGCKETAQREGVKDKSRCARSLRPDQEVVRVRKKHVAIERTVWLATCGSPRRSVSGPGVQFRVTFDVDFRNGILVPSVRLPN